MQVTVSEPTFQLNVTSPGTSGVSITGSPGTFGGSTNYTRTGIVSDTTISLTAPSSSGGQDFDSWSGCDLVGGAGNRTCNITVNSDRTVTVNYAAPTFTLNVNSSGASNVSISGSPGTFGGTTNYTRTGIASGTSISLTAPSSSGGQDFDSWSGCDSVGGSGNRTCTITVNSDRTVTVNYAAPTFTLNVNSSGTSNVSITGSPGTFGGTTNYARTGIASDTTINLTAPSLSSGQDFDSWSGCDSVGGAGNRTCTITVNSDRTVTVNYAAPGFTLNVNSSGASNVSITGSPGTFGGTTNYTRTGIANNTTISLTAPSSSGGQDFDSWSGCDSVGGAGNRTCTITVNSDRTVTAEYAAPSGIPNIVVTEVRAGSEPLDYVEYHNFGDSTIDLTGWQILIRIGNTVFDSHFGGVLIAPGEYKTLSSGANSWVSEPGPGYFGLKTAEGQAVDIVYWGDGSVNIPSGFNWEGLPFASLTNNNSIGRIGITDTNNAADWCYQEPSFGNQNPDCVIQNYTLSVNSSGTSSVSITGSPGTFGGTTNYTRTGIADDTTISLTAPSSSGGQDFDSWSGCDSVGGSGNRTCTITVNSDRTVTVNYAAPTFTLNVNSSGASNVSISGSPGSFGGTTNYTRTGIASDTTISLTAPETSSGANFSSWSGCGSTTGTGDRICNVSMTADRTVIANFDPDLSDLIFHSGFESSGTLNVICSAPGVAIPDNSSAGISTDIVIGEGGPLQSMELQLDISHTWVGDLIITLEHVESTTSIELVNRAVGANGTFGCNADNVNTGVADGAPVSLQTDCNDGGIEAYPDPVYSPNEPMSTFAGVPLAGTWRLSVSDNAGDDNGTINEWCLLLLPTGQNSLTFEDRLEEETP